jgi:hypothetical protein
LAELLWRRSDFTERKEVDTRIITFIGQAEFTSERQAQSKYIISSDIYRSKHSRFEHFLICEAVRLNQYTQSGFDLSFIRLSDKWEVDLVLSKPNGLLYLIEIKSTDNVIEKHTHGIAEIAKQFPEAKAFIWSLDRQTKYFGSVEAHFWMDGLRQVFNAS